MQRNYFFRYTLILLNLVLFSSTCFIFLSCGGSGGGATATPPSSSSTYSITGSVTLNGSGLSDVTMTMTGTRSASTTTDSSGNYIFAGVENGSYTITPSMSGYSFTATNQTVSISGSNYSISNFIAAATNAAVTLEWAQVTPFAVFAEDIASSTITIEAKISGVHPKMVARYFGNWFSNGAEPFKTIQLYDDGSHGDKVASDGIFTGQFIFSESVPKLRLYGGQVDHLQISVVALDSTDKYITYANSIDYSLDLGLVARSNRVTPVQLSDSMMTADSVVNVVDTAFYGDAASYNNYSSPRIMQTFYNKFPDSFDGFVIFSGGRIIGDGIPRALAIKNTVTGIGMPLSDASTAYGSQGKLKQGIWMNNNIGGEEFLHELAHAYGIYFNQSGLNLAASGGIGIHWGTSDIIGQMRGGYYLSQNTDGSFTATNAPGLSGPGWGTSAYAHNRYADIELYLMGLLPPEEVSPHIFLISGTLPAFGATIPAEATQTVTIDDIINTYGSRVPASSTAQKDFSFAFIVVSDKFISTAELTFINTIARYYASGPSGGTLVFGGAFPVPDPPSFTAATNSIGAMNTSLGL